MRQWRAVQGPHRRHLFRRARLRLQHRARWQEELAEPKCWADLLKPEFKDEVQVANPNSSGTAYTLLATIVQLMGEDKGFDYLKALHKNINQYTKSGAAPAKAAALGETTVGIAFLHDIVTMVVDRRADEGRRALRGHRLRDRLDVDHQGRQNLDNAKKFYDWALTPAAQKLGADSQVRTRCRRTRATPIPPQAPKLGEIKLIDYDFAKYGSSDERKRLLVEVGQRGQERCRNRRSRPCRRRARRSAPSSRSLHWQRSARAGSAIGLALPLSTGMSTGNTRLDRPGLGRLALLPWYGFDAPRRRLADYLVARIGPGARLTGAWWLLPILLPLLALRAAAVRPSRASTRDWLVAPALLGLA